MKAESFLLAGARSDVTRAKAAGRLFVLTNALTIAALESFLAGGATRDEIAAWADFFDVNEGVELESDEILPNVIFELSSPEINGELTESRAKELIAMLVSSK